MVQSNLNPTHSLPTMSELKCCWSQLMRLQEKHDAEGNKSTEKPLVRLQGPKFRGWAVRCPISIVGTTHGSGRCSRRPRFPPTLGVSPHQSLQSWGVLGQSSSRTLPAVLALMSSSPTFSCRPPTTGFSSPWIPLPFLFLSFSFLIWYLCCPQEIHRRSNYLLDPCPPFLTIT